MGIVFIIALVMLILGIAKKNKKIIIVSSVVLILSFGLIISFFMGLGRIGM